LTGVREPEFWLHKISSELSEKTKNVGERVA
jgi:hypothetical protein